MKGELIIPPKVSVNYEDTIHLPILTAFDYSMQWLHGQQKVKIGKKTNPPFLIEAKQGTMMTNSGFDPNWKKQIKINFFDIQGEQTLVRVEATILSRNIRTSHIEKLKLAWWDGLFSSLYSLLVKMEGGIRKETLKTVGPPIRVEQVEALKAKFCANCGKKIEEGITICPSCGIEIE